MESIKINLSVMLTDKLHAQTSQYSSPQLNFNLRVPLWNQLYRQFENPINSQLRSKLNTLRE